MSALIRFLLHALRARYGRLRPKYKDSVRPKNGLTDSSLEQLTHKADALIKAGQLAASVECYRASLQAYPGGVEAYVGMANALVDLWLPEEAIAAYGKALELAPHSS